MTHLLDTNPCVEVIRGRNQSVIANFRAHPVADLCVCAPVEGELRYGARRSTNPTAEMAKVDQFLAPLACLPFDSAASKECADIRADLEARGLPIGQADMEIAAVARAHGLTLVTHDTAEFGRVPGLPIVDWQVP